MSRRLNAIALLAALALLAASAPASAEAGFGLIPGSLATEPTNSDGSPELRASSHPYDYTVRFGLKTDAGGNTEGGAMRDAVIELPPGLIGNPLAVPRCTRQQFEGIVPACPPNTQIGIMRAVLPGIGEARGPIYNMTAPFGIAGQLGFSVAGYNALVNATVRSDGDYGLTVTANNIPTEATSVETTIWGTPADPSHDSERGQHAAEGSGGSVASDAPRQPYVTLPASCEQPPRVRVAVDSVLAPGIFDDQTAPFRDGGGNPAPLVGCEKVPFSPKISATPTTKLAESPSGLDFELSLPDDGLLSPDVLSETEPRKAVVTLPAGVTVNPSMVEGVDVCTPAQYAAEQIYSSPGEGCPQASKLGSVLATTPLLEEPLEGALYLAAPYENPYGSLVALYLVVRAPQRGTVIKLAGKVEFDPATGQIVSTFEGLPPIPYSSFKLHFREGARAPLVTPPSCGDYQTVSKLTPFGSEDPVTVTSAMKVTAGADGGACPAGGTPPFGAGFAAGTINNQAASHSPLYMRLTRHDGDQDLTKISTVLPQGLLASLVGVGRCTDAEIAAAAARTGPHGGREELNSPSCPASSQIGATMTGAGVGGVLTWVPGSLYLAGPYHGDPLSVVAVVPGVAGPFDVGTIVVRLALRFNPLTAQAEADGAASDPIPHILKGIPLKVRDIRIYVNRPNWTFNPTSCEPEATTATIWGGGADVFSAADDVPFGLSARFQAADCASLGFKPKLGLKLRGGTKRGKFPALHAVYSPRGQGDANLSRLALTFPHSEFIEQGHFRTICTRVQFAAGAGFGSECPKGSVYGHVKVWTPLLDEPLSGPVYLRSSNHNLPDAVFALHGIADIELATRIDSTHGRLRAIVGGAPDAPVSRAVVDMQEARRACSSTARTSVWASTAPASTPAPRTVVAS